MEGDRKAQIPKEQKAWLEGMAKVLSDQMASSIENAKDMLESAWLGGFEYAHSMPFTLVMESEGTGEENDQYFYKLRKDEDVLKLVVARFLHIYTNEDDWNDNLRELAQRIELYARRGNFFAAVDLVRKASTEPKYDFIRSWRWDEVDASGFVDADDDLGKVLKKMEQLDPVGG